MIITCVFPRKVTVPVGTRTGRLVLHILRTSPPWSRGRLRFGLVRGREDSDPVFDIRSLCDGGVEIATPVLGCVFQVRKLTCYPLL